MQTRFKTWKLMYFYWLIHCPEDISRVGNVLNITGLTIQGQERQLVQTPDCYLSKCQSFGPQVCSFLLWPQVGPPGRQTS